MDSGGDIVRDTRFYRNDGKKAKSRNGNSNKDPTEMLLFCPVRFLVQPKREALELTKRARTATYVCNERECNCVSDRFCTYVVTERNVNNLYLFV